MTYLGNPEQHTFSGSDGRQLNMLLYSNRAEGEAPGLVVPIIHGAAGDVLGNGNSYVTHLIGALPSQGVDVALLQRGGEGVISYAGGQTGGSASQTLESEVADTTAGLVALSELGYKRIVPVGFSVGTLLAAATVAAPNFREAISPSRVDHVIGLSPTRMNVWMGMANPREHKRLLAVADQAIDEGDAHRVITIDHRPYGLVWEAGAYKSMSSDEADPVGYMRTLFRDKVGLSLLVGTADRDVLGSYTNLPTMHRVIKKAHPNALIKSIGDAPHNMSGHEEQVEEFVLNALSLRRS